MEKKLKEIEAQHAGAAARDLHASPTTTRKRRPIHVLARGEYHEQGRTVGMRPLGVLLPDGTPELETGQAANRARRIGSSIRDHPLTARVVVNRIWQYHFGRGIVATPNDFGRMGAASDASRAARLPREPVRRERLAAGSRCIARSCSAARTGRRRSSPLAQSGGSEKDPENKLLWRFSRRRLEAEEIRDAMLAVSGVLNPKQGGPSIIVPVDKELVNLLYKPSQWAVTPDPAEHNRRSIYLMAKRNLRLPFMEAFDAPDLQISCARRESSTHAPQALELLNGDLSNRLAEAPRGAAREGSDDDLRKQVDLATGSRRAVAATEGNAARHALPERSSRCASSRSRC